MAEESVEALRAKLDDLESEHRDLDAVIDRLLDEGAFDQLQLQRLKKRKLKLRDQIQDVEAQLVPNIIA
ncbi:MAG: DUF465 domain-containing protein [Rhodospirillaceae bacterium]|nr:DUF465 domain-containing protein [Rhodospirillaceae bacterium]MBT6118587.1 DUF465 domain-containing protein [Rhodospirillaceae bacterium]